MQLKVTDILNIIVGQVFLMYTTAYWFEGSDYQWFVWLQWLVTVEHRNDILAWTCSGLQQESAMTRNLCFACIPSYEARSYVLSFQNNQPGMYPKLHPHIGLESDQQNGVQNTFTWQYPVLNDTNFSTRYHHPGTWYRQYWYLVLGITQH